MPPKFVKANTTVNPVHERQSPPMSAGENTIPRSTEQELPQTVQIDESTTGYEDNAGYGDVNRGENFRVRRSTASFDKSDTSEEIRALFSKGNFNRHKPKVAPQAPFGKGTFFPAVPVTRRKIALTGMVYPTGISSRIRESGRFTSAYGSKADAISNVPPPRLLDNDDSGCGCFEKTNYGSGRIKPSVVHVGSRAFAPAADTKVACDCDVTNSRALAKPRVELMSKSRPFGNPGGARARDNVANKPWSRLDWQTFDRASDWQQVPEASWEVTTDAPLESKEHPMTPEGVMLPRRDVALIKHEQDRDKSSGDYFKMIIRNPTKFGSLRARHYPEVSMRGHKMHKREVPSDQQVRRQHCPCKTTHPTPTRKLCTKSKKPCSSTRKRCSHRPGTRAPDG